jgi:type VI protein secretion system component Hcp
MNRRTGIYHCRGEVKSQQQATGELHHKSHEDNPTKTVKKANVRRNVFGARVIHKALTFHALLKPIE